MAYKILNQNGMYFLTFTIVEWIDLFTRPIYSEIILESFRFCQKEKGLNLYAYVIMPSHIHLIAGTEEKAGLSSIIQNFKSFTASSVVKYLKNYKNIESRRDWLLNHFAFNARKNSTHSQHQIWRRDNHPFELYSPRMIRQKLNYIHMNPVKAKMVANPEDYILSSASNYVSGNGVLEVTLLENIWDNTGYIGDAIRHSPFTINH